MITSTGNNFGGSAIEIKDYQSEKLIVLNAKFDIDTTSEAYQRADEGIAVGRESPDRL